MYPGCVTVEAPIKEASILERHVSALNAIHVRLTAHNDRLDVVMGKLYGNDSTNEAKSPEPAVPGLIQRAELLIEKLHRELDVMGNYISGIEKL